MQLVVLNEYGDLTINDELYGLIRFKEFRDNRISKGMSNTFIMTEMLYVYFMYDLRSDYMIYTEDERQPMIKEELGLDPLWVVDSVLQRFIDLYLELTETKISSMLKMAYSMVDKLKVYIEDMDLSDVDATGKPKYVLKDVIAAGNQLSIFASKVDELQALNAKQLKENNKMRGGRTKSIMEDGLD